MNEVKETDPFAPSAGQNDNSPGSILRRCREFHGLTLEEASETTKIGISHLKALENDEIGQFANQAYLKGFLRIYATYLGLNSDDVARMYNKLFGVKNEKTEPVPISAQRQQSRRLIPLKKFLFPAFLLLLILITATFFKQPPERPLHQPDPAPAPIAVAVIPLSTVQNVQSSARVNNTKLNNNATSKRPEQPLEAQPESEKIAPLKQPADATSGFILKIKVTQNGTLTVNVDGSGAQQYELTVGDAIEWKAEKKVALELSNAGGVDVELNGKPYKSLGPMGVPAYVELDASGPIR